MKASSTIMETKDAVRANIWHEEVRGLKTLPAAEVSIWLSCQRHHPNSPAPALWRVLRIPKLEKQRREWTCQGVSERWVYPETHTQIPWVDACRLKTSPAPGWPGKGCILPGRRSVSLRVKGLTLVACTFVIRSIFKAGNINSNFESRGYFKIWAR